MSADTTHHLLFDGPADLLEQALRDWSEGGKYAVEAGACSIWTRDASNLPEGVPHHPKLWISFEARGAQDDAVVSLYAEANPALVIRCIWYDHCTDCGATTLYEAGEVEDAEAFSYAAAYHYTYGEDDPTIGEDDEEEGEDAA